MSDDLTTLLAGGEGNNSIVNLRIEETKINKRTAHSLAFWLKRSKWILSFGLIKVKFEDSNDFKLIIDALSSAQRLKKLSL
jgi:hypothetical protein